jgi:hypothetical protein
MLAVELPQMLDDLNERMSDLVRLGHAVVITLATRTREDIVDMFGRHRSIVSLRMELSVFSNKSALATTFAEVKTERRCERRAEGCND